MKIRLMTMTAIAATMIAAPAFAQSPAGSPADPNSAQNRQVGPNAGTPTDPAAGASPSARVPTAPVEPAPGANEGMSEGESARQHRRPEFPRTRTAPRTVSRARTRHADGSRRRFEAECACSDRSVTS